MKNFKKSGGIAIIAILIMLLVGCDLASLASSKLIGKWSGTYLGLATYQLVIKSDHTFIMTTSAFGETYTTGGTWVADASTITITDSTTNDTTVLSYSLNNNLLTLTNADMLAPLQLTKS